MAVARAGWYRALTLLGLRAVLSGCGLLESEECPSDLRWAYEPKQANVRVGESFVARAQAFGCAGTQELTVDMRWTSSDFNVAAVDERSGRVVATGVGQATLEGRDLSPFNIGPFEIPIVVSR
jgi:hypothetical protein